MAHYLKNVPIYENHTFEMICCVKPALVIHSVGIRPPGGVKRVNDSDNSGMVYIITDGEYHKIGMTIGDANKRIKEIQTMNPRKLDVLYQQHTSWAWDYEHLLHELFEKKRVRGEWFMLEPADIQTIKDIMNDKIYARVGPRAFIKKQDGKPSHVRRKANIYRYYENQSPPKIETAAST